MESSKEIKLNIKNYRNQKYYLAKLERQMPNILDNIDYLQFVEGNRRNYMQRQLGHRSDNFANSTITYQDKIIDLRNDIIERLFNNIITLQNNDGGIYNKLENILQNNIFTFIVSIHEMPREIIGIENNLIYLFQTIKPETSGLKRRYKNYLKKVYELKKRFDIKVDENGKLKHKIVDLKKLLEMYRNKDGQIFLRFPGSEVKLPDEQNKMLDNGIKISNEIIDMLIQNTNLIKNIQTKFNKICKNKYKQNFIYKKLKFFTTNDEYTLDKTKFRNFIKNIIALDIEKNTYKKENKKTKEISDVDYIKELPVENDIFLETSVDGSKTSVDGSKTSAYRTTGGKTQKRKNKKTRKQRK